MIRNLGQDFGSWLIWPRGLFILQHFTSRYCLIINCTAKKRSVNSPLLTIHAIPTAPRASRPVVKPGPDEQIAAQPDFVSRPNKPSGLPCSISSSLSRLLRPWTIRSREINLLEALTGASDIGVIADIFLPASNEG
jgi:hypothetical protein